MQHIAYIRAQRGVRQTEDRSGAADSILASERR